MKISNVATPIWVVLLAALAAAMSGCGKNESNTTSTPAAAAASTAATPAEAPAMADTSVAEPAIACLMKAYGNGLGDVLKPELRANAPASIPKDQLVVWSSKENIFAAECGVATGDAVTKALQEAPYVVVNEAAKRSITQQTTFTPSAKGEYEKTADYEKRIAAEKAAFEAAAKGRTLGARDIEIAWSATFGAPSVYRGNVKDDPDNHAYDADHEILTFLIKSRAASIPISVNMSVANMQALDKAVSEGMWGSPTIATLGLDVFMQYANGKLTMKYIGFHSDAQVIQDRLKALPFDVSAIPVDQEIFFQFGT